MAIPFATEAYRLSNVLKQEFWPEHAFCRAVAVVNESAAKTYAPGTVLGRVITSGTAAATAASGNTGNGAMGAITVTAPAQVGTYRLAIIAVTANAGTFVVVAPNGVTVGTGTVGVAFSKGGLAFTLADGATDFALGDAFDIVVSGTYKYKIAVETATDGSKVAAAIVMEDKTVAATTDTNVLVLVKGPAVVSKSGLILDATYDLAAEKAAIYATLEGLGISVYDAV